MGRGCGSAGEWKGATTGALSRFYRERKERGATAGVMAINGHGGASALVASRGKA
jgi:hypothetical protein